MVAAIRHRRKDVICRSRSCPSNPLAGSGSHGARLGRLLIDRRGLHWRRFLGSERGLVSEHSQVDVDVNFHVKMIRRRLRLTRDEFSRRFGIPQGRLRDWEQGRGRPEGPARARLLVIQHEPKAVERALARAMP